MKCWAACWADSLAADGGAASGVQAEEPVEMAAKRATAVLPSGDARGVGGPSRASSWPSEAERCRPSSSSGGWPPAWRRGGAPTPSCTAFPKWCWWLRGRATPPSCLRCRSSERRRAFSAATAAATLFTRSNERRGSSGGLPPPWLALGGAATCCGAAPGGAAAKLAAPCSGRMDGKVPAAAAGADSRGGEPLGVRPANEWEGHRAIWISQNALRRRGAAAKAGLV